MALVNGADGIGTGWSTNIPQFNPLELCEEIINKIEGKQFNELVPWYKGFKGTIEPFSKKQAFVVRGVYSVLDEDCLEITELPIKKWTKDYK